MKRLTTRRILIFVLTALTIWALQIPACSETTGTLGPAPGADGQLFSEWQRLSMYVTVRDGTRLAADIFRPFKDGKPVAEPLPVVWTHYRYHRGEVRNGKQVALLDLFSWTRALVQHGYIVAAVDVRGSGASFGTRRGEFAPEEAQDAYDVTEWLAKQPWSSGKIGMFGRSYQGITQYMAAGTIPPHLKAIFPEMAMFDLYALIYPGGVMRHGFTYNWGQLIRQLDTTPALPVDDDLDGTLLASALKEHLGNINVYQVSAGLPYRDSKYEPIGGSPYDLWNPANYLSNIKESGVAVYHLAGWFDMWSRDALVWFNNLDNPQKITIGPWAHQQSQGLDLGQEHLRWFDYWLKGIDNGIMREPPIKYYAMGAPAGTEWRTATQWPLPEAKPVSYYFAAGPSGSVKSANDGSLALRKPAETAVADRYTVDYSASSGTSTRWVSGYGGPFSYPNMAPNDAKGLTYTTPPLTADVEVTGHPIVHLWVNSTAKDGDFFAYLEEVNADGVSIYVTEGVLRASHRRVSTPSFDYMGLPYHRGLASDLEELPAGQPVELVFDLYPTAVVFDQGHRIRVTITCADQFNAYTPVTSPAPVVGVQLDATHSSRIELPVVPR